MQVYIDTNDIGALFDLLHELEIDFNQQYPISDPFYKKPLDIDKSAKVIGGKGSGTLLVKGSGTLIGTLDFSSVCLMN